MKVPILPSLQVTPSAEKSALATLEKLRSTDLTSEEMEILEQFEDFQREHPFQLSSLEEEG
jgi:hypothetical protein